MKYKWLLFDADNTLFDFHAASRLAFNDLMHSLELKSNDALYDAYCTRNHEVWSAFEEEKIDSQELRSRRFQLFFEDQNLDLDPHLANAAYLKLLINHAALIDGAKSMIHDLKQEEYPMVIITNGLKEVQRPRLRSAGLYGYFDHIIVSDEIGVAKPSFEYFDYVNDLLRRPEKKDVLVIGDSLKSDIAGGINYGYDTCWYDIDQKAESGDLRPTFSVNTLEELKEIIY